MNFLINFIHFPLLVAFVFPYFPQFTTLKSQSYHSKIVNLNTIMKKIFRSHFSPSANSHIAYCILNFRTNNMKAWHQDKALHVLNLQVWNNIFTKYDTFKKSEKKTTQLLDAGTGLSS